MITAVLTHERRHISIFNRLENSVASIIDVSQLPLATKITKISCDVALVPLLTHHMPRVE